ncbi:hypothetical protein HOY82DRAFT_537709 [Tuber indicum]|nr:hypothetical protein HOY82DRAFT_537709 [Tuber indicum]
MTRTNISDSPASTKLHTRPVHLATTSVFATNLLKNTSLQNPLCNTQQGVNMEFPSWIKDLRFEKIAKLQVENEGNVQLGKISGVALRHWDKQNLLILSKHLQGSWVMRMGSQKKLPDRLWLLYTGGATRVVIVVCMREIIATQGVFCDMEKRHTSDTEEMAGNTHNLGTHNMDGSSVEETADDGRALGIHDSGGSSVEETVGDGPALGIDDTEAKKLLELNRNGKLKRLLLGGQKATIRLYRAAKDNTNIVEIFMATLLPQPPSDSPGPSKFSILLHDILGTNA